MTLTALHPLMLQAYPYFYVPYADDLPTEPAEGVACCTCVGRASLVHDVALAQLHLHTAAVCTGIPDKQEVVPQLFVHQSSSAEQSSSSSAPAHDWKP
jgi:hypothetical protein